MADKCIMGILVFEDVDLSENPENGLFPVNLFILHQDHKVRPWRNFPDFLLCVDMYTVSIFVRLNPK